MNTVILVLAVTVLGLVALSLLPGLEHLVRPLVDLLFSGLKLAIEHSWSWLIWLAKTLWRSHAEVFKHMALSDEAIDPSVVVRKKPY